MRFRRRKRVVVTAVVTDVNKTIARMKTVKTVFGNEWRQVTGLKPGENERAGAEITGDWADDLLRLCDYHARLKLP